MSLIVGNIDPHSYELVKGDDEKFNSAEIIFFNGLGLEHGASLHSHLNEKSKAISLGGYLLEKDKDSLIFIGDQVDPHIWMDVRLFSKVIDPIVKALSEKEPLYQGFFQRRGKELKEKMLEKDVDCYQKMQKIPS